MTFFAPNGQPLTPGTPQYTQAITQQVAQAAYTEEQLRRREEQLRREGDDDVPPVPHVPSSRPEPARYVPGEMPRPPRQRRWIGCWGWLAIFFLASAITGLTYAGVKDYISDLFTGTALVLAVAISAVLRRRSIR